MVITVSLVKHPLPHFFPPLPPTPASPISPPSILPLFIQFETHLLMLKINLPSFKVSACFITKSKILKNNIAE